MNQRPLVDRLREALRHDPQEVQDAAYEYRRTAAVCFATEKVVEGAELLKAARNSGATMMAQTILFDALAKLEQALAAVEAK